MTSGVEAVTRPETALDAGVFALDCDREVRRIGLLLKRTLVRFRRRGVVLGLSGGWTVRCARRLRPRRSAGDGCSVW